MQTLSIILCEKKCVLLGDLNIVRDNAQLKIFCEPFLFEHLINKQVAIRTIPQKAILYHTFQNV